MNILGHVKIVKQHFTFYLLPPRLVPWLRLCRQHEPQRHDHLFPRFFRRSSSHAFMVRSLIIAALCRLERKDGVWIVPSQTASDKK
jgi:hypothetical protein